VSAEYELMTLLRAYDHGTLPFNESSRAVDLFTELQDWVAEAFEEQLADVGRKLEAEAEEELSGLVKSLLDHLKDEFETKMGIHPDYEFRIIEIIEGELCS
jgi:hypothetical protein